MIYEPNLGPRLLPSDYSQTHQRTPSLVLVLGVLLMHPYADPDPYADPGPYADPDPDPNPEPNPNPDPEGGRRARGRVMILSWPWSFELLLEMFGLVNYGNPGIIPQWYIWGWIFMWHCTPVNRPSDGGNKPGGVELSCLGLDLGLGLGLGLGLVLP